MSSIIEKITNTKPDTYIIFYYPECPYCKNALNILREHTQKGIIAGYKGYNIHNMSGGITQLLDSLTQNADLIKFKIDHTTVPMIFWNGTFIGGSDSLSAHINTR
jgi:glutaredoxin